MCWIVPFLPPSCQINSLGLSSSPTNFDSSYLHQFFVLFFDSWFIELLLTRTVEPAYRCYDNRLSTLIVGAILIWLLHPIFYLVTFYILNRLIDPLIVFAIAELCCERRFVLVGLKLASLCHFEFSPAWRSWVQTQVWCQVWTHIFWSTTPLEALLFGIS